MAGKEHSPMRTSNARKFSRLISLGTDERVQRIQEAVRACEAAGRGRLHVANGEYKWPLWLVSLADELRLSGVPDAQILAVGDAVRDAFYDTVYVGTGVPAEPSGELVAAEQMADGRADAAKAKLIDRPHCPQTRHEVDEAVSQHITLLERLRRGLRGRGQVTHA